MNALRIFAFLFLLSASFFQTLFSQEVFTNEKRADYVFYFIQYVKWEKKMPSQLKLLIMSEDPALKKAFEEKAEKQTGLKAKRIVVESSKSLTDIPDAHVVFVQSSDGYDISDVLYEVAGKQILLITEDFPFNKSMVNFRVVEGKREFELNPPRLKREGFKVDPLLAAHAVKDEDDWQKLYLQAEDEAMNKSLKVKQLAKEIEKKQEVLAEQLRQIANQEAEIAEQKKHIKQQMVELRSLYGRISQKEIELQEKQDELNDKVTQIEARKHDIAEQKKQLLVDKNRIKGLDLLARKKQVEIQQQNEKLEEQIVLIRNQRYLIYLFSAIGFFALLAVYFILRAYYIKKKSGRLLQEKNNEIVAQNEQITEQNEQITEQNREITDSILYASRIQRALLPPVEIIEKNCCQHFILYRPRDIVSGDYYWMAEAEDNLVVVAADCTGHGVPGAFMSMLGMAFLNEIVKEKGILSTDQILNRLRTYIMNTLNQEGKTEETKDGMDMSICLINRKAKKMQCSAAYNSIFMIRNNELKTIKADRMPVGLSDKSGESFSLQEFDLEENDTIYMLSDGYVDQFGGPKQKKFMSKRFKNLLLELQHKTMAEQKEALDVALDDWMAGHEQIDDILVMGIKM